MLPISVGVVVFLVQRRLPLGLLYWTYFGHVLYFSCWVFEGFPSLRSIGALLVWRCKLLYGGVPGWWGSLWNCYFRHIFVHVIFLFFALGALKFHVMLSGIVLYDVLGLIIHLLWSEVILSLHTGAGTCMCIQVHVSGKGQAPQLLRFYVFRVIIFIDEGGCEVPVSL